MRILMLNNEFPPLGGGTGVVNYHLLRELAGYEDIWVDLVTSSRSRGTYETEHFADRITLYKVPVNNTNIHHSSNPELSRYAWRGLRQSYALIQRYDYDLSFAFAGVPAGAISYALNVITGLPYIVSLQGPDVPGFEARYNYLYPFLKPFLQRIWHASSAVIAISEEHRQLAHETAPDLEIPIIYNGVETEIFRPPPSECRQDDCISILCVGRLIERKGQPFLLRAFAELYADYGTQLRLHLVGTGDAEADLRRLATELGIDEGVTFHGFVPRENMPEIYRRASVFVLPSQNEGMSIALLEAMASGLPVVVTNTGGTNELVTPERNGLVVEWADVDALKRALCKLVRDAPLRQKMGAASRRRALVFSWPEITKHYVMLMNAVRTPETEHFYV